MSNEEPTITLCVTAHRQNYLIECLMSIASQVAESYNLILCSDATGDPKVVEIFEKFAPFMRARKVTIMSARGGTAGRTRNAAFEAAKTQWVTYLDGDDLIRPDALREIIRTTQNVDAEIITTGLFRVNQEGIPVDAPESLVYKPPVWLYQIDPRTVGHWAFFNQMLAIRRDLWCRYPFSNEDTNREDVDFMLHQLLAGRSVKISQALYGYRKISDSFSARKYGEFDICRKRYSSGYYAKLFYESYRTTLADNFS